MPILALTTDASTGSLTACLQAGMNGYIAKAASPARLTDIVAGHLARTEGTTVDAVASQIAERLRPKQMAAQREACRQLDEWASSCRDGEAAAWRAVGRIAHDLAGSSALFGDHDLAGKASTLDRMVADALAQDDGAALLADDMAAALLCFHDALRRSVEEVVG